VCFPLVRGERAGKRSGHLPAMGKGQAAGNMARPRPAASPPPRWAQWRSGRAERPGLGGNGPAIPTSFRLGSESPQAYKNHRFDSARRGGRCRGEAHRPYPIGDRLVELCGVITPERRCLRSGISLTVLPLPDCTGSPVERRDRRPEVGRGQLNRCSTGCTRATPEFVGVERPDRSPRDRGRRSAGIREPSAAGARSISHRRSISPRAHPD